MSVQPLLLHAALPVVATSVSAVAKGAKQLTAGFAELLSGGADATGEVTSFSPSERLSQLTQHIKEFLTASGKPPAFTLDVAVSASGTTIQAIGENSNLLNSALTESPLGKELSELASELAHSWSPTSSEASLRLSPAGWSLQT